MNQNEFIEKVAHVAVTKIKEGMGWTEEVGYHVDTFSFQESIHIGGHIVTSDVRHRFFVSLGVERNAYDNYVPVPYLPHVVIVEFDDGDRKFSLQFNSRFNRFICNYQSNLEAMKKSIAGNVFQQTLSGEYKGVKILKTPELVKSELIGISRID